MVWFYSLNTIVTGGIAGIDTTTMDPLAAARLFLRVRPRLLLLRT